MSLYEQFGKRLLDVVVSLCAALLMTPLMALVALGIVLDDGGHPLFFQKRVGRNGASFTLVKFRSMPINTKDVPSAEAKVRFTRIGGIIRRTNVDELPQLFCILRGDMSLVGPRPALAAQTELLAMRQQNGAILCKPGLTGLAQVNSYDGMPDEEKAWWDGEYANHVSFLTDIKIMLRTLTYLLKPPPVY